MYAMQSGMHGYLVCIDVEVCGCLVQAGVMIASLVPRGNVVTHMIANDSVLF